MATPAGTLRVGPYFLSLLGVFAVLYGIVFWPGQQHTPKLGLDLKGGAQIILKAKTPNGGTPSSSAMTQARQIMERRVNGIGVAGAQVVVQGNDRINIQVPGINLDKLQNVGRAAQLNFRPVVLPPVIATAQTPVVTGAPATSTRSTTAGATAGTTPSTARSSSTGASTTPSSSKSPQDAANRPLSAPTTTAAATPTPSTSKAPATTPSASPTATRPPKSVDPLKNLGFPIPTTDTAYNALTPAAQVKLKTAMANFDCKNGAAVQGDPSKPILYCDSVETAQAQVFLLGPVIVRGTQIDTAAAVAPDLSGTGGSAQWTVRLTLKGSGQDAWSKYTAAHHSDSGGNVPAISTCGQASSAGVPCAEYVAFTLDGVVISYPHNEATINGADTTISGSFTEQSANELADQLKYGALPLDFAPETSQSVTATLGTAQLKAGLLAGGIGLVLVVVYSLLYYRGLGLVTIASLVVSGGLTYACLVMLGREIGFTLTLAGIAGFIVAVGITADSFVVFFERLKDEVHEGRSMRVAVPRAWVRARRTILSADTVSFLAAAVLYYFTVGDVRGFAFTLGLSTILDLVVVFLFTHPMVSLLSRSARFGSARFSGLSALRGAPRAEAVPAEPAPGPARERARARRGLPARSEAKGAVVVLDKPELDRADIDRTDPDATDPDRTDPDRTDPDATDLDATDLDAETGAAEPAERPEARTPERGAPPARPARAPQPGTAAERAAARRARLRESGRPNTPKGRS